ncbi:MAG: hypothetical protein KGI25_07265, partial [Thaumarchaeota archaeon]|nr:hypothetical protein [Nitrososphaerota archaeon]
NQGDWQYGNVISPHFSAVFQTPIPIKIPEAACTVISSTLAKAGISSTLIQQILTELNCS